MRNILFGVKRGEERVTVIRSFESNGRFYFDDGRKTIETVELIDCNLVVHDSLFGYIYKSRTIDEYEKKDWFCKAKRPAAKGIGRDFYVIFMLSFIHVNQTDQWEKPHWSVFASSLSFFVSNCLILIGSWLICNRCFYCLLNQHVSQFRQLCPYPEQ